MENENWKLHQTKPFILQTFNHKVLLTHIQVFRISSMRDILKLYILFEIFSYCLYRLIVYVPNKILPIYGK